jgi:potassium-transporting ATPase KdpC subunit
MKTILKDIKLHLLTLILFGIAYPLLIWAVGLLFPSQSIGLPIYKNSRLIGFENIGQKFYSDKYFWGRPSAVDYKAASTGASNLAPTNPEYISEVENRIEYFLKTNQGIKRKQILSDLVTESGSGIDPDLSVQSALIQIPRIARVRKISEIELNKLVEKHIEKPLFGLFGPEKINVLLLNIALDNYIKQH